MYTFSANVAYVVGVIVHVRCAYGGKVIAANITFFIGVFILMTGALAADVIASAGCSKHHYRCRHCQH